jgi:hypothetical protein
VIVQRLRRATVETATQAARAFVSHWDAEEKPHFRLKELTASPTTLRSSACSSTTC